MTQYVKNPVGFLRSSGLLFELNRRVLHPFGVALAVETDEADMENSVSFTAQLVDARDDPDGFLFAPETYDSGWLRFRRFTMSQADRLARRIKTLGWLEQNTRFDDERAELAVEDTSNGT